ncbi:MAG: hypothetical protein ACREOU_09520 [Candidatus Eiseniibacteriota bacterium]
MNEKRSIWSCEDPRFLAFALVIAAIILGGAFLGKTMPKESPGRIAVALVQGAASAALILGMFSSIRRLDELQQRMHLEALAFSFGGTGILATGYGFLVGAGLPDIEWGTIVWPVMCGLWAIGLLISHRRYR